MSMRCIHHENTAAKPVHARLSTRSGATTSAIIDRAWTTVIPATVIPVTAEATFTPIGVKSPSRSPI